MKSGHIGVEKQTRHKNKLKQCLWQVLGRMQPEPIGSLQVLGRMCPGPIGSLQVLGRMCPGPIVFLKSFIHSGLPSLVRVFHVLRFITVAEEHETGTNLCYVGSSIIFALMFLLVFFTRFKKINLSFKSALSDSHLFRKRFDVFLLFFELWRASIWLISISGLDWIGCRSWSGVGLGIKSGLLTRSGWTSH